MSFLLSLSTPDYSAEYLLSSTDELVIAFVVMVLAIAILTGWATWIGREDDR